MPTDTITPSPGQGGLPRIELVAGDGARAEIYLHGAHVTSWHPAGEAEDQLFLSPRSAFATGEAIRGGVPVCWPQFADQGSLPMHGFVRTVPWQLVRVGRRADGGAEAVLRSAATATTRAIWPHTFALEYTVAIAGRTLAMTLSVTNADTAPFAFTCALHTYLAVRQLRAARVRGLAGAHYRDKVEKQDDVVEAAPELPIDRFIDRVYRAAPADLALVEPNRALSLGTEGFFDTVVWNPDAARCATMADMEPDGYLHMLCVEAAVAHRPVTLAPGAEWRGRQTLTAL